MSDLQPFVTPPGIARFVNVEQIGEAAERAKAVRRLMIPHARFKEGLDEVYAQHRLFDPRPNGEASALMFTGRTGTGKSKTLRYYAAQFPPEDTGDRTIRRVLYVPLPPGADRFSMQRRVMAALGVPILRNRTADQLSLDIRYHLVEQGVELLILDEANHLVDTRTNKTQFLAADVLKELASWNCCQMVFGGLASALQILEVNHQILRRSFGRFEAAPYHWRDDASRTETLNFLGTIADEIPWFTHRPALDDEGLAEPIARAAGGAVGLMVTQVAKSVEIATKLEASRLARKHFAAAFDVLKPIGTIGNPFSGKLSGLKFPEGYHGVMDLYEDDSSPVRREGAPGVKEPEDA
jgi:hypothetical protein